LIGCDIIEETTDMGIERKGYSGMMNKALNCLEGEELSPDELEMFTDYARAQMRLCQGRREKARKILRKYHKDLSKREKFNRFDEKHDYLLAKVDVAIRGETNRGKIQIYKPLSVKKI
jgi:hypothetical protein